MADSGNVRLEGHTDERGTREYNLLWVNVVQMRCVITW